MARPFKLSFGATIFLIAAHVLAVPAEARPGWCRNSPLNPTEQTICSDGRLGSLDDQLGRSYRSLGGSEQLTADQRDWLRRRNRCGRQHDCIEAAYRERLSYLAGLQDGASYVHSSPIVSYRPGWCNSSGLNPTEQTICATQFLHIFDNQIIEYYRSIYGPGPLNAEQLAWLRVRNSCGRDASCIRSQYRWRIDELAQIRGGSARPHDIAPTRAHRGRFCSDTEYDDLRDHCFVLFAAEYGCNEGFAATFTNESGLINRSATSGAICSIAVQSLLNHEIDPASLFLSVSAGISDDVADSLFENGDIVSAMFGVLAQGYTVTALGAGVGLCLDAVDRECGR